MEVSPSLLRGTGAALRDVAAEVRSARSADRSGDRDGPGDPDWATDSALRAQASAWDGYLGGLADRLDDVGDRLHQAADGYADADTRSQRRLGRRLC
jgi:uncharacterized protein YukE